MDVVEEPDERLDSEGEAEVGEVEEGGEVEGEVSGGAEEEEPEKETSSLKEEEEKDAVVPHLERFGMSG